MLVPVFNDYKLLRVQVYEYLREQMRTGALKPGDTIKINELIKKLGVSRTPLREALLLLHAYGFVSILPQRGIIINDLTVEEVKKIYEIVGGLESRLILSVFEKIDKPELDRMKRINEEMLSSLKTDKFNYYERNLAFHDVFINLSENKQMINLIKTFKQRLYEFPVKDFGDKWKKINYKEHNKFILLLGKNQIKEAAEYLRDVHWHFKYPESFK